MTPIQHVGRPGTVSERVLRRTLWQRQHLHERVPAGHPSADAESMSRHLVGLQAQDPLPPYLGLAARLDGFDPRTASAALADRRLVRVLLQRGTIRLVTPQDAVLLRPLVRPLLDRAGRTAGNAHAAAHLPVASVRGAGREVLEDGPLRVGALGRALEERFPDVPGSALVNVLRYVEPLVQVPPRALWARSGGVVYQTLDRWTGLALAGSHAPGADASHSDPDATRAAGAGVVRRYLAAYGPASAADFTAWSGITGARALVEALGDEVVTYRTEDGKTVHDLAGLPLADPDLPAPARLLGTYDDVFIAHAGRDRATTPEARARWAGSNGGTAATVFLDGTLAGLWRATPQGKVDLDLFGTPTRAEVDELADEVDRVEALLAVPADDA
ncbi:winged helix DNA-binding domain-containing protein [Luteimicrobium subarcticum]|uniref:Winged helix DNA-binding protein n=1 Tax=Luteimicrobium subarcticum TaxID=620910 RepID=A0A2M8W1G0_9MICO|nr:winged helix DNA-binding domain-containing protein [Luteimicrobium subarcticum]PJI84738.1 winged helix DNA-binding protein [Luteimicrobium subarcticum]